MVQPATATRNIVFFASPGILGTAERPSVRDLLNDPRLQRFTRMQMEVDLARAQYFGVSLEDVRRDPSLLDIYVADNFRTNDLLQLGLGNFPRHVAVLTAVFADLTDQQVHDNGRWSFADRSKKNATYIMPAEIAGLKGLKIIQSHPGNIPLGLPRSTATILLFDVETGLLRATVAASVVTPVKTAAQSAVVLRLWHEQNRKGTFNLGILGGGPVAREHFRAFSAMLGSSLGMATFHSPDDSARALVESICAADKDHRATFSKDPAGLQSSADIIVGATTARQSVIDEQIVKEPSGSRLIFSIGPNDVSIAGLQAAELVIVDDPIGSRELKNSVGAFLNTSPSNVLSLSELIRNPQTLAGKSSVIFAPIGLGLADIALCADLLNPQ